MNARRAGFTLVEVLIAMAVLSVVVTAAFQVLQGQGDAIRFQRTTIDVQQTNRTVSAVLAGELREVSPAESDLAMAAPESLTVRLVRKMGVVCNPDLANNRLNLWILADTFAVGDSVTIFADGNAQTGADDSWIYARVSVVDGVPSTVTKCDPWLSYGRKRIHFAAPLPGVQRGAPVRSFTRMTYGVYPKNGEWVLGRRGAETGDTVVALIGPLRGADGLRFEYLDAAGTVLTPSTQALRDSVRLIRITVRSKGGVADGSYSDSLVTQVYLRNN